MLSFLGMKCLGKKGEMQRGDSLSLSLSHLSSLALHLCFALAWPDISELERVMGLTGFVIIYVFIASFSPAQGERNQMVNTKFTRPVNAMPMSSRDSVAHGER